MGNGAIVCNDSAGVLGIRFGVVAMVFAMTEALTIIFKANDPTRVAKQISLSQLGSIKLDKEKSNVVLSRKAVQEDLNSEEREKIFATIQEGSLISGTVKNLTDYGAFIDLGGIDGLVHVTDISWTKINNPSDVLELNSTIKIKVLKFDEELSRLSLGIKQLTENPWDTVGDNIKKDTVKKGIPNRWNK